MHYSPAPMHIPDGLLSGLVALLLWALAALILGYALRRVGGEQKDRQVPLMGVMAAFIFAAQMINFPVAAGTSGHLLGGALAAVTLGPWVGMLTMTSVVIVQGLLFQDGGLLVMGANVVNMGVLTVMIGYGLYRGAAARPVKTRLVAAGIAAWLSVMAAALATSLELWLSGAARLDLVVPAMLGVHALIGLGEALITVAALSFIFQARPDLLSTGEEAGSGSRGWVIAGLLLSLTVVLLAPLASINPDGLERVATDLGFLDRSAAASFMVLPDYTLPILGQTSLSTILAGALGVLVVAAVSILIMLILRRQRQSAQN